MPEMKRVYNLKTEAVHMMFAVDAREAVKNGKGEWSYTKEEGGGVPPMVLNDQSMSPGVVKPPKKVEKSDKDDKEQKFDKDGRAIDESEGGEAEIPDGFGPEKGGEAVHYISGETRMLVAEGDAENVPHVQPYARRATKAEQVAASNDGMDVDPDAPPPPEGGEGEGEGEGTPVSMRRGKRQSASRRKPVKRASPPEAKDDE